MGDSVGFQCQVQFCLVGGLKSNQTATGYCQNIDATIRSLGISCIADHDYGLQASQLCSVIDLLYWQLIQLLYILWKLIFRNDIFVSVPVQTPKSFIENICCLKQQRLTIIFWEVIKGKSNKWQHLEYLGLPLPTAWKVNSFVQAWDFCQIVYSFRGKNCHPKQNKLI